MGGVFFFSFAPADSRDRTKSSLYLYGCPWSCGVPFFFFLNSLSSTPFPSLHKRAAHARRGSSGIMSIMKGFGGARTRANRTPPTAEHVVCRRRTTHKNKFVLGGQRRIKATFFILSCVLEYLLYSTDYCSLLVLLEVYFTRHLCDGCQVFPDLCDTGTLQAFIADSRPRSLVLPSNASIDPSHHQLPSHTFFFLSSLVSLSSRLFCFFRPRSRKNFGPVRRQRLVSKPKFDPETGVPPGWATLPLGARG